MQVAFGVSANKAMAHENPGYLGVRVSSKVEISIRDLALLKVADSMLARRVYVWCKGPYSRRRDHAAETPEVVDRHYRDYDGDYTDQQSFSHAARYGAVAEWIKRLVPVGGSVLDIGAGDGQLAAALAQLAICYVGVDFAADIVRKMNASVGVAGQRQFIHADATVFEPSHQQHVIVFNDMLYYLEDPVGVVERLSRWLVRGGSIIVTMYLSGLQIRLMDGLLKRFTSVERLYLYNSLGQPFVQMLLSRKV